MYLGGGEKNVRRKAALRKRVCCMQAMQCKWLHGRRDGQKARSRDVSTRST